MKKRNLFFIGTALIIAWIACSGLADLAPTSSASPVSIQATPLAEPGIPAVVDKLYLGIPAGNGHSPYHVAVDSQRQRVYSLNMGSSHFDQGNTISVVDLETNQVTRLIELHNMEAGDFFPPDPLDLQIDPYRARLYVLWGDRYSENVDSSLTILDADTLAVINTLPGAESLAVGPDRLYLANDKRLWSVDPDSLAELETQALEPRTLNEPLLLDAQNNRLYLARAYPPSLEIFEADALSPVGSYDVAEDLAGALVDTSKGRLLILENEGDQVVLRVLSLDGVPLSQPGATPISDNVYLDLRLAFDGQYLYVANGNYQDYRIETFALPNFEPVDRLPLPTQPNDLDIDPATGRLYAAYSSWSHYILEIDPATGQTEPVYTALAISDALVDSDAERLYVLDDSGRLRVLNPADGRQTTEAETGYRALEGQNTGYGQLSLDPGRSRLYIGGDPVRVLDTQSLEEIAQINGRGQLTPDPTGDRLYLTPPCNCRMEQCNTLILSAETLTGTQTLFPPEDPFSAPCVVTTNLDFENQLLYAQIYNGIPGSNSGAYYFVFDVETRPEQIYSTFDISYGQTALDPVRGRAFAPRYRIGYSSIDRFGTQAGSFTQTLVVSGAYGQLAYDPDYNRLYAVQEKGLQVFDGDLALLSEISLPANLNLLTLDSQGQRLYLSDDDANLLVVATGGGDLETPPPSHTTSDQLETQQIIIAPDATLFRVYDRRLYRSNDGGGTWELLGQGLPGRPVMDLDISPDYKADRTLLAGLTDFNLGGGLYRSRDGGDTWHPATRGLTDLRVTEIVFSPTFAQDRTIFITTANQGLFRSTDEGDTWTPLGHTYAQDPYDRDIQHVALSPTFAQDNLVLIAKNHLLRSDDGGETWVDTRVPGGLIAFSPTFARDGLIFSAGRWRGMDGGKTWQPAAVGREPGEAEQLLFSPFFAADQTIYLLLRQDYAASLHLQRSTDAGRSWDSLVGGLPTGFEITTAALLPTGKLQLNALDGREFTAWPKALEWGPGPVDISRFELESLAVASDGTLFAANGEAGLFRSRDGGRSWNETGFPARSDAVLQPARLWVAGDDTLFGAAGMVLARSTDGGGTWSHLDGVPLGFEIASLAVSPNYPSDGILVIGGTYANNQILRSADRGETWETVFDAKSLNIEYASDITAIAFSPDFARDQMLYAWLQDGGLLRSDDGGFTWILVEKSDYYGQTLAVSPEGDRLYLGALYGHVLVSEDGGRSWQDLRDEIPDDRVWSTALAFGPGDSIFLGTDRGVYRSLDGGRTWAGAGAGLPLRIEGDAPQGVRALAFHGGRLYAALAEGGLFVSDDQGSTWRDALTGRPATPIETSPTATPSSQALPATPTPQAVIALPDCPAQPEHFGDLWSERMSQLGCPVAAYSVPMAEQSFEGGMMFWRSDTTEIYALPTGAPYAHFDDTWDESQPTYSCPDLFPTQTPPTPQRGFGKVWCNHPQVRKLLGQATSPERLVGTTIQEFEAGLIFGTDQGAVYILENRPNDWEQVE